MSRGTFPIQLAVERRVSLAEEPPKWGILDEGPAMRHCVNAVVVLLVLGAGPSPGQEAGGWVGQRVVTRFGAVLKVGRQVVADPGRSNTDRGFGSRMSSASTGSNGRAGNGCGWWPRTKASAAGSRPPRLCPLTARSTYYTGAIRANPKIARPTSGGDLWH